MLGVGPLLRTERLTRVLRQLGLTPLLLAATILAAPWTPLLKTAGYELFLLWALILSFALPLRVARRMWMTKRVPGFGALRDMLMAAAFVGPLILLAAAVGQLTERCGPSQSLMWGAALALGPIPWLVAIGHTLSLLKRGRRALLFLAFLWLVAAIEALRFFLLHPPLVSWSSFVGFVAGSLYDEALGGTAAVWIFRAWTSLLGLALVAVLRVLGRPSPIRAWLAVVSLLAVIGGDALMRNHGPVYTRARVAAELGGFIETDNFRIYYDADTFQGASLESLIADHELNYRDLELFWGGAPDFKIGSWIYGSPDQRARLTGARSTLFARIWLGEVHSYWRVPGDEVLRHELAHVFLKNDGRGPLRLAPGYMGLPSMGLVEGAATAAAWGATDLSYHGWSAAIFELGMAPDLSRAFGPRGFWSQPSGLAYTLMGSFVRWLIDERGGPERFRALYSSGEDFEGVYEQPLELLLESWQGWLGELELDEQALDQARARYDRPSIFGRRCARAAADELLRIETAGRRGDTAAVASAAARLTRISPDELNMHLQAADRLWAMNEAALAAQLAASVRSREGAGAARRRRAMLILTDIAWAEGRLEEARAMTWSALQEPITEAERWQWELREHGLDERTHPSVSSLLMRWLAAKPTPPWSTLAMEMAAWAEATDDPYLRALVAAWWWRYGEELPWLLQAGRCADPAEHIAECRELVYRSRSGSLRGDVETCLNWHYLRSVYPRWSAVHVEAERQLSRCEDL